MINKVVQKGKFKVIILTNCLYFVMIKLKVIDKTHNKHICNLGKKVLVLNNMFY